MVKAVSKATPEKLLRAQSLRNMMQNPLSEKLKELTDLLTPLQDGMLLSEAAQKNRN